MVSETLKSNSIESAEGSFTQNVIECNSFKIYIEVTTRSDPSCPTILFVNGALTTTGSLRWATKNLTEYNIAVFDFPVFGQSLSFNSDIDVITKEQEVEIVTRLCEIYEPEYLLSLSWGGTSTLLALAQQPKSVQKAIVSSYSVGLTSKMRAMVEELITLIEKDDIESAGNVTIANLGEFLPDRMKRLFLGYFLGLTHKQLQNVAGQLRYMLSLSEQDELAKLRNINIPVLFGNGSMDCLTSPESILPIESYVRDATFTIIEGAGHFMALESKKLCEKTCDGIRDFLPS